MDKKESEGAMRLQISVCCLKILKVNNHFRQSKDQNETSPRRRIDLKQETIKQTRNHKSIILININRLGNDMKLFIAQSLAQI